MNLHSLPQGKNIKRDGGKMFGKKKDKPIRVMHYEGLKDFNQDYPCTIELKNDQLTIQRIKPEATVTLPANRILAIDTMEEEKFMLKYHNEKVTTSKTKGVGKHYIVIRFNTPEGLESYLSFWGTVFEYGQFIEMQKQHLNSASTSYTL